MTEPTRQRETAHDAPAATGTRAARRAQSRVGPMPMLPHLQELEAWRALAALAVMLTHAGFLSGATGRHTLPGFLARMDIGVAVFFVLSGFLLYRPYSIATARNEPQPSTRRFLSRRVARIVPAWLAVLAGTLVLVPQSRAADLTLWLVNLVHLQALRLEWDLPGLAQLWSLSTEVAFYAILPILAVLVRRLVAGRSPLTHLLAVAALIPLAWAFRAVVYADLLPDGYAWVRTMPAMIDWFALGMILAVLMTYRDRWSGVIDILTHSANALLVLAAATFWVLTTSIAGPYDLRPPTPWQGSMKHLGYGIVASLLIYPSALGARSILTGVLRSRVLAYLGKISYAFFLWHLPVMFWVRATLGYELFAFGFWVTVLATTVITTAISALSWHLLERPILETVRRRT
jgi:peptidoglycan/LPS O-acetylase OafA/YrhL